MDRVGVGKVCLALPGATLDHPFGDDHDAYKVGGKMFAIVGGMGGLSFKVSDIAFEVLTENGRAKAKKILRFDQVCLACLRWSSRELQLIEHFQFGLLHQRISGGRWRE